MLLLVIFLKRRKFISKKNEVWINDTKQVFIEHLHLRLESQVCHNQVDLAWKTTNNSLWASKLTRKIKHKWLFCKFM